MHTMGTIKNRRRQRRIYIPLCDETELGCLNNWMTAIPVKLPLKGGGTEERVLFVNPAREESCLYKKDYGRYEREDGIVRFDCGGRTFEWEFCCGGYKPSHFPPETAGVIGCDFMRANALALDFGHRALYTSCGMEGLHPGRLGYFFRFKDSGVSCPSIALRVGGKMFSCRFTCESVSMMRLKDLKKDGFESEQVIVEDEEVNPGAPEWYKVSIVCVDGSEEFRRPKRVKFADIFCCFDGFCYGKKLRRNEIWLGPYLMQKDGAVIDFGIGAFYKLKYGMGIGINNE